MLKYQLLLALFICACDDPGQNITEKSYRRLGMAAIQAGDPQTAIRFLELYLDQTPEDQEIQLTYARLLIESQQAPKAIERLELLKKKTPENPKIAYLYGLAFNRLDQPEKALASLKPFLSSKDPDVLRVLAATNDRLGQHQTAQRLYRELLKLDPNNKDVLSNFGLSLAMTGDTAEAIRVLRRVCKHPQVNARDRHNLATAYALAGDLNMAAQVFRIDLPESKVRENLAYFRGKVKPI